MTGSSDLKSALKIAIVSDYVKQGGAAIACNRLAVSLADAGNEVRRFALERGPRPANSHPQLTYVSEPFGRRAGAVIELASAFDCQVFSRFLRLKEVERRLVGALREWQPDIVNVHNLHAFSPQFSLVPKLAKLAPVVWTLHDMWSFTGRCAYSDNCRQFETGCTASCPTAFEYPAIPSALISSEWKNRERFFAINKRVTAVTPSQWLANEAGRGLWRKHRIEVIPYSLDLQLYQPIERNIARTALGLPETGRPYVLLAADYLSERRKGGAMISPALAACRHEITILTLGNHAPANLPPNAHLVHLGYISEERTKALVYSAADLLLHAAPTDNLPNTVIESLACGTPVLAFRTGGLPEMVLPSKTGWLVEELSEEALGKMLSIALDSIVEMAPPRVEIRSFAEENYSPAKQSTAYRRLFDSLIMSPRF